MMLDDEKTIDVYCIEDYILSVIAYISITAKLNIVTLYITKFKEEFLK